MQEMFVVCKGVVFDVERKKNQFFALIIKYIFVFIFFFNSKRTSILILIINFVFVFFYINLIFFSPSIPLFFFFLIT